MHDELGRSVGDGEKGEERPAVPVLIAQGGGWHFLIVSIRRNAMTVQQKVDIRSTQLCFDALKVLAVWQWLMGWAAMMWQPWFLRLIAAAPG